METWQIVVSSAILLVGIILMLMLGGGSYLRANWNWKWFFGTLAFVALVLLIINYFPSIRNFFESFNLGFPGSFAFGIIVGLVLLGAGLGWGLTGKKYLKLSSGQEPKMKEIAAGLMGILYIVLNTMMYSLMENAWTNLVFFLQKEVAITFFLVGIPVVRSLLFDIKPVPWRRIIGSIVAVSMLFDLLTYIAKCYGWDVESIVNNPAQYPTEMIIAGSTFTGIILLITLLAFKWGRLVTLVAAIILLIFGYAYYMEGITPKDVVHNLVQWRPQHSSQPAIQETSGVIRNVPDQLVVIQPSKSFTEIPYRQDYKTLVEIAKPGGALIIAKADQINPNAPAIRVPEGAEKIPSFRFPVGPQSLWVQVSEKPITLRIQTVRR